MNEVTAEWVHKADVTRQIARRHPHRRGEWLVLFSVDEFDSGVGNFDDCGECHCRILPKVKISA